MLKSRTITTLIFVMLFSLLAKAQDSSTFTIHFPSYIPLKNLLIGYMDGKHSFGYTKVGSHDVTLTRPRYFRYADVYVFYQDSTSWFKNTFWVGNLPADICILSDISKKSPFTHYQLKNAICLLDSGMAQLTLLEKPIADSIEAKSNLQKKMRSDSLGNVIEALFTKIIYTDLAFVQQHPKSSYAFWLFRSRLAPSDRIPSDTLLYAYNHIFPEDIRSTPEGKYVVETIQKRLASQIGKMAPNYSIRTTIGTTISSQNTRGKFVLLNFWASWCGPCVAEMPEVSRIREKFDTSKVLIVSITLDKHQNEFEAAATKLKMNWPLVFGDQTIIGEYNVSGIPITFLIDPNGQIIYKSFEENEKGPILIDDAQLSKLNSLLNQQLAHN